MVFRVSRFRLHCTQRRVILPLHVPTVKSRAPMPHRLTILRPPATGIALAAAVGRLTAVPLRLEQSELPRASAHLACGDFETVRALIRGAVPGPALPLMLARYVRWTGDLQGAAAIWPTVLSALDMVLENEADHELRQQTAALLGGAATDLGDAALAARLYRYAREGASSAHDDIAAYVPDRSDDQDVNVICDVAHDLLGIDPDASRGRLRLRPRLAEHAVLEARHIRFADGSVSITASRTRSSSAYRVEQVEGSIPVTLLLEPFVEHPQSAEIDGRPADLAPRTVARGVIVPVQLVLDDVRTLVVSTAGG